LRLKDGENQVLAGLINSEERRTGNKLPGLGDIPIASRLFGQQIDDSTKTEIVLSITPRIARNLQRPAEFVSLEFDSGTESNLNNYNPLGSQVSKLSSQQHTTRQARSADASSRRPSQRCVQPFHQSGVGPALDVAVMRCKAPLRPK